MKLINKITTLFGTRRKGDLEKELDKEVEIDAPLSDGQLLYYAFSKNALPKVKVTLRQLRNARRASLLGMAIFAGTAMYYAFDSCGSWKGVYEQTSKYFRDAAEHWHLLCP